MSDSHAADIDKRVRGYLVIGGTLLLMTGVTVAVAWVDLPTKLGIAVALLIAAFKGSLVAAYFMHLISEKKVIYSVLILTVAFFIVLMFVPLWTEGDTYGIRSG